MLQSSVETKSLPEIIEYYYSWKKYCPDEYRGRNRHVSEEVGIGLLFIFHNKLVKFYYSHLLVWKLGS